MEKLDDYRLTAHQIILKLDAATIATMQLISAYQMTGAKWNSAIAHQRDCYDRWQRYLTELAVARVNPRENQTR